VVADEQLEDALDIMLQQGLEKSQGPVEWEATIAPLGWPGYALKSPPISQFLAYGPLGSKFIEKHMSTFRYAMPTSNAAILRR